MWVYFRGEHSREVGKRKDERKRKGSYCISKLAAITKQAYKYIMAQIWYKFIFCSSNNPGQVKWVVRMPCVLSYSGIQADESSIIFNT